MVFNQALHGSLEHNSYLHSEFSCHLLQQRPEIVAHRAHGVEGIFLIIRIMSYNPLKEFAEGIGNQAREIRVCHEVLGYEPCVLGAETVWERLGINRVNKLFVVQHEFPLGKGVNILRHVMADEVRDEALTKIAAATFVAQDKAAGIHVEALVAAVVQAGVGAGPEDCGKARLPLEQRPA